MVIKGPLPVLPLVYTVVGKSEMGFLRSFDEVGDAAVSSFIQQRHPSCENALRSSLRALEHHNNGDVIGRKELGPIITLPVIPKNDSQLTCINCNKVLPIKGRGCRKSATCIICRWPVCEDGCVFERENKIKNMHTAMECISLYKAECRGLVWNGDPSLYNYLWMLRIVLFKVGLRCRWMFDKLLKMNSFQPERNGSLLVKKFKRFFPVPTLSVSDLELEKIHNMIVWEMETSPLSDANPYFRDRARRLMVDSRLSHSCYPSVQRSNLNENELIVLRALKPFDILSVSYDRGSVFSPTSDRRRRLNHLYSFNCQCSRCVDSSEFGTNFSLFPCDSDPCLSRTLPENFKLDIHHSVWQPVSYFRESRRSSVAFECFYCKAERATDDFLNNCVTFNIEISRSKDDLALLSEYLREVNQSKMLHVTHFLFFHASWTLLELLYETVSSVDFLEDKKYLDFIFSVESVHVVVQTLYPDLFKTEHLSVFRTIAMIKLALLTHDLKTFRKSETESDENRISVIDVERKLMNIFYPAECDFGTLSSRLLELASEGLDACQEGTFASVERYGIIQFVEEVQHLLEWKTRVFQFRFIAD